MIIKVKNVNVDLPDLEKKIYEQATSMLSIGLKSKKKNRDIIAEVFHFLVNAAPNENPSDLWHHVVYRLYTSKVKGTNAEQSWVRTSGEAFETFFAEFYNPLLERHGILLEPLISKTLKQEFIKAIGLSDQMGSSKIDVGIRKNGKAIGGLHCKASLAERVSDDVPASRQMMKKGLLSILITLDVKSFPPPHGDLINRGELGTVAKPSDKRRYIEEHGEFTDCFSFNTRTAASGKNTNSGAKIFAIDFGKRKKVFIDQLLSRIR